jgi:elongation factor P
MEDYNSVEINVELIGNNRNFLIENMEIGIAFYEGRPLTIQFPKAINLRVSYAEPWVKGDSVSNNLKPVELETGYKIKVPMFINEGDLVRIDTETGSYLERIKVIRVSIVVKILMRH